MTYYNLSFMDNSTGITAIAAGVNTNSGGWLFGLLLLFLWMLLFIVFSDRDTKTVFLGSSFIVSLAGGLLLGAGLVEWWILIFPVVGLVVGLVIKLWSDG